MESTRFMRDVPTAGRRSARTKELGIPCRQSRCAMIERIDDRRGACDTPSHPRSAEIRIPAEPNQPASRAASLGGDGKPAGSREVEGRGIAP
jgi:hypothetical protein